MDGNELLEIADRSPTHATVHVSVLLECAAALDDRDRLGWIISESDHGNTSLLDDLWGIASKLCPLNYKEAEDIQKWLRAAIDAARSAK